MVRYLYIPETTILALMSLTIIGKNGIAITVKTRKALVDLSQSFVYTNRTTDYIEAYYNHKARNLHRYCSINNFCQATRLLRRDIEKSAAEEGWSDKDIQKLIETVQGEYQKVNNDLEKMKP